MLDFVAQVGGYPFQAADSDGLAERPDRPGGKPVRKDGRKSAPKCRENVGLAVEK